MLGHHLSAPAGVRLKYWKLAHVKLMAVCALLSKTNAVEMEGYRLRVDQGQEVKGVSDYGWIGWIGELGGRYVSGCLLGR